ncbi:hypothetical protein OR16_04732 [Cupriavidus basilensis OR16]|uniref:Uncharacterized protein n=1 Tax=Cupriavidus basilensis OR16 TaxID=1127483 RepID=H1S038_9BURK|nr:hypothetical protein [Cupriavidus basilensis]EHP44254.1 hypothetical protein OR16_04732 [Cupriavidus basilensis OR16]
MSASLFDLHIARTSPDEYAALREANARYRALAVRFPDGDTAVTEAHCLSAKDDADRAETAARAAFHLAFQTLARRKTTW